MSVLSLENLSPLAKVLTVTLSICWGIAAAHPVYGLITLSIVSFFVTLPYFFFRLAPRYAWNTFVSLGLLVGSVIWPPLWPLVGVWAVVCLVLKWSVFVRNLPLMAAGFGVYLATMLVPYSLLQVTVALFGGGGPLLAVLLAGFGGGYLFAQLLNLLETRGAESDRAAALMLGSNSFLFLFVVSLLVPGARDGGHGFE